jgi:hypothetical protein
VVLWDSHRDIGGIVPGMGVVVLNIKNAFAFAALKFSTPVNTENKSAKVNVAANAVLFITAPNNNTLN